MPSDSYEGSCHLNAFNEVLDEISNTCVKYDTNQFIIGGDMNVDFKRIVSTHTKALNRFLIRESMTSGLQHVLCDVDYTFMSKINGNRSTIDHFLLTDNLFNTICRYRCIHEGDNLSDHSILQVELQLPVQYCTESHATVRHATTQWHKVEIAQLEQYRIQLDRLLESVHVPEEVVNCTMYECGRHNQAIEQLYNGIVNACLTAGKLALPQRNESVRRAPISRWHEDVAERRDSAMWWHFIWQQNGSPNNGVVADIRRRTRAAYHYAIRYAKKQSEVIQANALADHLLNKRANDFWNEIKRIKGNTKQRSAMVDGVSSDNNISELFAGKYCRLFNSVSYTQHDMSDVFSNIKEAYYGDDSKCSGSCLCRRLVNVKNILEALRKIKLGKSDGETGLSTDYLKNGSHKLHVYISILFSVMLSHGYVPKAMRTSSIIPIPKNGRKSVNDSDNYRGIALSSVLGKVLDWVILHTCSDALKTTHYQFGFKPDHATTQCTFVVKETIQYYLNGGSQVYTMLLDASQAFDRVNYVTLFNILLKRGLCPLVCRLLAMIYTCQSARIKWGETFSKEFSITNGVKQGGVLSPVLFSIYMDELFVSLYASKVGCHIGQQFMGAFGYADDVILLAPTKRSLYSLLDICIAFSLKYQVKFNSQKSKLIVFNNGNNEEQKSIVFNGQVIDAQLHDVHLGHIIGNNTCDLSIQHSKDDLIRRVNVLLSNFRNVYIDIKYRLFKTFCMSLYGCLLWDLSSNSVNMINIAWRKCIRRLFGLPPRTHNALIHAICNDIPIDAQIHIRFLKFMKGCLLSSNPCIQLCARLAIDGSNSDACKSVNFICSKYDINKYIIPTVSYRDSICTYFSCTEDYSVSAGAICDLCYIRDHIIHTTNFDIYEVEYMIDYLCLS